MKNTIIIWEMNPERIHTLRNNAELALNKLGIDALLQINCEEPLISRNGLLGKLPSIQINEDKQVWNCGYGKDISEEEFIQLFSFLLKKGILNFN